MHRRICLNVNGIHRRVECRRWLHLRQRSGLFVIDLLSGSINASFAAVLTSITVVSMARSIHRRLRVSDAVSIKSRSSTEFDSMHFGTMPVIGSNHFRAQCKSVRIRAEDTPAYYVACHVSGVVILWRCQRHAETEAK